MTFNLGDLRQLSEHPLTIQASWINDSEFIGYFVAMATGLYSQAGLSVRHLPGHAGLVPEEALLAGVADIALTSPEFLAATARRTGETFRIIGAQFQKSPLGIVSRASNPVTNIGDLRGRRLAVPAMNEQLVLDVLSQAGLDGTSVALCPYDHGPSMLIDNEADAVVDFIIDAQWRLRQAAIVPAALLLYDNGAPLFNNVAVVRAADLEARNGISADWLAASRLGWIENFRDPDRYPSRLRGTYLDPSRTLDHEIFANRAYQPLIDDGTGILSLDPKRVEATVNYLYRLGFEGSNSLFASAGPPQV